MTKLPLHNKKILFVGYGAVAKAVWNHFDLYFTYDPDRVYAVDQFKTAFVGPRVSDLNTHVLHISADTFDPLLKTLGFVEGDIVIDLTYDSCSYFFIRRCLELGIHYMNTSIEDKSDVFHGSSIDAQQKRVAEIMVECRSRIPIRSNVLTECGQNPGLIQHYVFHALDRMRRLTHPMSGSDYRPSTMIETLKAFQVGSMLFSEIDDQVAATPPSPLVFTNTWSVSGFLTEALDPTELVRGRQNPWIQPPIEHQDLHALRMELYQPHQSEEYEVMFLHEKGINVTLPSIVPLWTTEGLQYVAFRGKLIHHGEMFELARYFGDHAPFMTYVYQNNPYMDASLAQFMQQYPYSTVHDVLMYANQPQTFRVLDQGTGAVVGQDSIGVTLFCGQDKVERIFWCGSLFRDTDAHHPYFTPTTVQVAAGVLSGLSYILEEKNQARGWIQSSDMDTEYILDKAVALLGTFFFTEIPVHLLEEPFRIKQDTKVYL